MFRKWVVTALERAGRGDGGAAASVPGCEGGVRADPITMETPGAAPDVPQPERCDATMAIVG